MKLTLLFSLALFSCSAFAADLEVAATSPPKFPNKPVVNRDGKTLKFYDDLVKGKVVAINFVFSSCPTICPLMEVNFAKLQKNLKKAGLKEVQLISVTVDPTTDTPARLKEWSKEFSPEKGWAFVTGEKSDIDHILKKLEVFTADIDDHPSFILMGNDTTRKWKRANILAPIELLTKELTALATPVTEVKSK